MPLCALGASPALAGPREATGHPEHYVANHSSSGLPAERKIWLARIERPAATSVAAQLEAEPRESDRYHVENNLRQVPEYDRAAAGLGTARDLDGGCGPRPCRQPCHEHDSDDDDSHEQRRLCQIN